MIEYIKNLITKPAYLFTPIDKLALCSLIIIGLIIFSVCCFTIIFLGCRIVDKIKGEKK